MAGPLFTNESDGIGHGQTTSPAEGQAVGLGFAMPRQVDQEGVLTRRPQRPRPGKHRSTVAMQRVEQDHRGLVRAGTEMPPRNRRRRLPRDLDHRKWKVLRRRPDRAIRRSDEPPGHEPKHHRYDER